MWLQTPSGRCAHLASTRGLLHLEVRLGQGFRQARFSRRRRSRPCAGYRGPRALARPLPCSRHKRSTASWPTPGRGVSPRSVGCSRTCSVQSCSGARAIAPTAASCSAAPGSSGRSDGGPGRARRDDPGRRGHWATRGACPVERVICPCCACCVPCFRSAVLRAPARHRRLRQAQMGRQGLALHAKADTTQVRLQPRQACSAPARLSFTVTKGQNVSGSGGDLTGNPLPDKAGPDRRTRSLDPIAGADRWTWDPGVRGNDDARDKRIGRPLACPSPAATPGVSVSDCADDKSAPMPTAPRSR